MVSFLRILILGEKNGAKAENGEKNGIILRFWDKNLQDLLSASGFIQGKTKEKSQNGEENGIILSKTVCLGAKW